MIRSCLHLDLRGDLDIFRLLQSHHLLSSEIARPPRNMLPVLHEVEAKLPKLLAQRTLWQSLFIDYQPPYLLRTYCDVTSQTLNGKIVRASLHYFLPVSKSDIALVDNTNDGSSENLYHPHAWASCMRLVDGVYDQYIGFANRAGLNVIPPKLCLLTHRTGDSYALNHPWLWHQVNPRPDQPVSTLMVTHIPECWDQEIPRSTKPLRALTPDELDFMFHHFGSLLASRNAS